MNENLFNQETLPQESTEEAVLLKKKRVRRTKAEMEAARAKEQETVLFDNDDKRQWPIVRQLGYVQQHLHCPKNNINKEEDNTFFFRNVSDIYVALKPILEQVGCTIYNSDVELRETSGGNYYILTLVFENIRAEKRITKVVVKESDELQMFDTQASGCIMSYAMKYALCQMLLIDDSNGEPDMDSLPHKTTNQQTKGNDNKVSNPKKDETPEPQSLQPLILNSTEYKKEVFTLFAWNGTKDKYIENLKSRYDVSDDVLTALLNVKTSFAA